MNRAMRNIERVKDTFDDLAYMRHSDATFMQNFIIQHDVKDILEIGFFHGKSSAYFAAILEDLGRGHLVTIDRDTARQRDPNIENVLSTLKLAHRVTPIYADRSYTWEMAKMIGTQPRPEFDLCYFDGDHLWDGTGFGFMLVDVLLRPGGWIIFDDLKWTIDGASKGRGKVPRSWQACSSDEKASPAVRMVFDLLVPHLGYTERTTANSGWWGIARKPLDKAPGAAQPRAGGLFEGIRQVFSKH
jgi:predicted O-methyltransferase YrrM